MNEKSTIGSEPARYSKSQLYNNVSHPTLSDTAEAAFSHFQDYARERPEVVALWCLGIGFVLGWKLKPW